MNKKFLKMCVGIRVLPQKVSMSVRVVVVVGLSVVLFTPLKSLVVGEGFTFRHIDIESGISCYVSDAGGVSLECGVSELIGLDLRELELVKKDWVYILPNEEKITFSREGYSSGIKITATSDRFSEEIVALIPYSEG